VSGWPDDPIRSFFELDQVDGNELELVPDAGGTFTASLTPEAARGTVTLADGTEVDFQAELVSPPAADMPPRSP
jgi:hypothetical protein